MPDTAKRLELQNAVRVTLLQALGAAFLFAGAYLTWRQLELNRIQLTHTLASSTTQLQLSREGQVDDMFSRALENLGHEKVGVRVGAIYSLGATRPDVRSLAPRHS